MNDLSLNSMFLSSYKRDTSKSSPIDPADENETLRNTIEKLTNGLQNLKAESQRKTEQITELQKWTQNLISLNATNYESAMTKVREGLENYFFLKEDICELKKEIMYEKRKILVTTERYNKAKEDLNKLKREMAATPAGMLFIEKTNLEATLRQSSEEVEALSERNEKLLRDLKINDFFEEYEKASGELGKLREDFNGFLKKTKLVKPKSPRKEPTNLKKLFAMNCSSVHKNF